MRVLHLSDVHYSLGMPPGGVFPEEPLSLAAAAFYPAMLDRLGNTLPAFEACLREGLATRPDAVVLTGDFVERGGAEAYRAVGAAYQRISQEVAGGVLPCVVTPGNHDDRAGLRAGWPEPLPGAGDEPLLYTCEVAGAVLISLDTSEAGHGDGYLDVARLDWLRGVLAQAQDEDKPALVCTHHHVDPGQSDMLPLPGAAELLEVLRSAHAVLVNGHTHHQAHRVFEGVPYYTADATSFQADPLDVALADGASARAVRFRQLRGYNVYDVEDGRIVRAQAQTFDAGRVLGDMILG